MPRLLNNQPRRISIYRLQRRPSFGFESSVSSTLMTSGDPVIPPCGSMVGILSYLFNALERPGQRPGNQFFSVCVSVNGCRTITSPILYRFSSNSACGSEMWSLRRRLYVRRTGVVFRALRPSTEWTPLYRYCLSFTDQRLLDVLGRDCTQRIPCFLTFAKHTTPVLAVDVRPLVKQSCK